MIQLVSKDMTLTDELLVTYLIQLLKSPTQAPINVIELLVGDKGASLSFNEFKAELPYLSDKEYEKAAYILQPAMLRTLPSEEETIIIRLRQLAAA